MTLKLVEGEFSSLGEAMSAQVLMMAAENAELREDLLQVEAHKARLRKRCAEEYRKSVTHIKRLLARR